MVTINELSKLCNVSKSTVTRVLNHPHLVKKETREVVLAMVKKHGYSPNFVARSLSLGKSDTIGLLIPNNEMGFFGSMVSACNNKVMQHDKTLIMVEGGTGILERQLIQRLVSLQCEGLILYSRDIPKDELIDLTQGLPTVFLNKRIESKLEDCVYFNNRDAGHAITKMLIEKGHRNISCIGGPQDSFSGRERLCGYFKAMDEYGIPYDTRNYACGSYSLATGSTATAEILDKNPHTTGIVYCSEIVSASGVKVLHDNNIRIPQDISVATFDSYYLSKYLHPALDMILFPITEMALYATELLLYKLGCLAQKPANNFHEVQISDENSVKTIS